MTDLSEQLARLIDDAGRVELADVIEHPLGPSEPGSRWRRPLTLAAAALVVVAAGILGGRALPSDDRGSVQISTPTSPRRVDSFGAPGTCGDGTLTGTVRFEGPLAAGTCLGVDERISSANETVVKVLRDGSDLELTRFIVGSCANGGGGGTSEVSLADGTTGFLQYGSVPADVPYVRFTVPETGQTYIAETVQPDGVETSRFFSILLPGAHGTLEPVPLDANSKVMPYEYPQCDPSGHTTTVEGAESIMAGLIDEESERSGLRVGDPCPTPTETGTRLEQLSALVGGDPTTHEDCRVLAWMPMNNIPGVIPGYYAQDGTLIWNMIQDPGGPPDLYALLQGQQQSS